MTSRRARLDEVGLGAVSLFRRTVDAYEYGLSLKEVGVVESVGSGIACVRGLPGARTEELLRFTGNRYGMVFNLDPDEIGVVMLDDTDGIQAGSEVRRTDRILDVPVGESLLGRVVDPMGNALDEKGPVRTTDRRPAEREAPGIMQREAVTVPLQTGIKVIDALIPVGRGQRELILGDRQTGKTAIAIDTIINQKDSGVICFYCAIGQRSSAVAKLIADLEKHGAMDYSVVVAAMADDPPGLQYIAPYAAASMAEYFMDLGRNVLVVYDDLTTHARAYRELSLLLRRPPGREAYPGDVFYIHSRLLERATHLSREHGGGSLTALPIAQTEAGNMSAFIPTNLVSITDGQIYLCSQLFRKGILPAVDVGKSVSRVGGKTQVAAYRSVAGDLRLMYSQFEELEAFSRFGTRLDEETRRTLDRGRRVREVLKQGRYRPLDVPRQIAVLLAVNEGLFDELAPGRIAWAQERVGDEFVKARPELCRRILCGHKLSDEDRADLLDVVRKALEDDA